MAKPDKKPVTMEELLVSSLAQTDALAKLMIDTGSNYARRVHGEALREGGGIMTVEDNKAVVRSFFEEALDKGNVGLVDDIFTEDCVFHRGDLTEPARGIPGIRSIVEKRVQLYRDFRTTIHQMIGEGDLVATRETHRGIHRGQLPTPIGTFDVTGRPIEWTSQVLFRFEDDKISETWVARDELGILRYLGIVLEARVK
jgi:predicted ester cyclase